MSHEPMHRVIRLKRYEQPPQGYHEGFLREFHHRQRAELLRPSLSALLMERITSLVTDIRVPAMAYAGAALVAVIAGAVILRQAPPSDTPRAYSVSYSQAPVTIQKMQPVSLRGDAAATMMQSNATFPPSYLLQARPASYESPLSF
jgi:hypothetical protein